ncbi:hypothetical protein BSKO_11881 [Bryopsis sp. KO-2023]|nr:hypothetical protein BSKO_11881 [Bryopsis sp. KO-2023]
MSQSDPSTTPPARFTRKSLDGEYRLYTAAVITTGSLWLAALVWDRGFLEGEGNTFFFGVIKGNIPLPVQWILWSLILFFWAFVDGIFCFLALLPNVQIGEQQGVEINWVMFYGLFGVGSMNFASLALFWLGKDKFKKKVRSKVFFSTTAHFYIHGCLWLAVFVMDLLYIVTVHWAHTRAKRARIPQPPRSDGKLNFKTMIGDVTVDVVGGFIEVFLVKLPLRIWGHIQPLVTPIVAKTQPILQRWYNFLLRIESDSTRNVERNPVRPESSQPNGVNAGANHGTGGGEATGALAMLSTWKNIGINSVKRGAESAHACVAVRVLSVIEVFSEAEEVFAFKHSAWVVSGMVTSLMLLPYWAVQYAAFVRDFVSKVYIPHRNCVSQNRVIYRDVLRVLGYGERRIPDSLLLRNELADVLEENLDRFRQPREGVDLFYDCNSEETVLSSGVTFLNVVHENFSEDDDPVKKFTDSTLGSFVFAVDAIVVHLYWASVIGAILGVIFALRTLISVLGQYKRASKAAWERTESASLPESVSIMSVLELESPAERWRQARFFKVVNFREEWKKTYPLDMAAHFIGALVSTVALQMLSVFVVSSLIFAALGSLLHILAAIYPFLSLFFVTAATVVFEELVLRKAWIKSIVSGYTVHQPLKWLFYLITHSMINVILGLLRAFLRLLGMILVAILRLGRLDVNQYPIFQSWDTAEVAFGATVLMHHQADVGGPTHPGGHNESLSNLQVPRVSSTDIDAAYERERVADSHRAQHSRSLSSQLANMRIVSPFEIAPFPPQGRSRGTEASSPRGRFPSRAESPEGSLLSERLHELGESGVSSREGSLSGSLRFRRGHDLGGSGILSRAEQGLDPSPPPSPSR